MRRSQPKPRDPSAHLRARGALRQRVVKNARKYTRKTKHRRRNSDDIS